MGLGGNDMGFPYTLPTFNLTANIWRDTSSVLDPPDVVSPAQLYVNSRMVIPLTPGDDAVYVPCVLLRVPKGTDLQEDDQVQVDAADFWFYRCRWVERVHRGFPNEYFVGILEHPGGSPPVSEGIETETGDPIVTEGGDRIITE